MYKTPKTIDYIPVEWRLIIGDNFRHEIIYYRKINKNDKKYEKPKIVKQTKMQFPLDIIETESGQKVCKQCSSCHSCR